MSCKISILGEGSTEVAFRGSLRAYLKQRLPRGKLPRLDFLAQDGRLSCSWQTISRQREQAETPALLRSS